jgi:hypothetical protein
MLNSTQSPGQVGPADINKLPQVSPPGRGQGVQVLTIWHDTCDMTGGVVFTRPDGHSLPAPEASRTGRAGRANSQRDGRAA